MKVRVVPLPFTLTLDPLPGETVSQSRKRHVCHSELSEESRLIEKLANTDFSANASE